jgi:hypothetical protein
MQHARPAVAYLSPSSSKRKGGSPELVYLLVVLIAGGATAWWAGERIGIDLSALEAVPTLMGVGQTVRPLNRDVRQTVSVPSAVASEVAEATAPYCNAGQTPAFQFGLVELKQRLGDTMGVPTECEHPASANGDTVQQTTTGLAAYHRASNTVTFTDGWQHWALAPDGLIFWEGTQSEPPPRSS